MTKKILYIDMDGTISDFNGAIQEAYPDMDMSDFAANEKTIDEHCAKNPDIFHHLKPIKGAIEAIDTLWPHYEIYFLSTPMWDLPSSWEGKRIWVEKHFGEKVKRRLILTHRKDLSLGDYLIDDRLKNGAGEFKGELIHFATDKYPDWDAVLNHLLTSKPQNNTMSKNIKDLIEQVKAGAEKELEYCNQVDTPAVCQMIADAEGKAKVIDLIVEYVGKNGMTIGEAINYIERDNNPKLSN